MPWFLYGFGFGWGISVDFGNRISETLGLDIFTSDMLANFLIDVADKAMTTFLSVLLYYAVPKKLIELFSPIKNQVSLIKKDQTKPSEYKLSLRTKVMLLVGTATTLVAISAMVIGILQYHNSTINEYTLTGQAITKTIAQELDTDRIDEFIDEGKTDNDYNDFMRMMESIRSSSPEVRFIYIYRIHKDGCEVVFDLDTQDVEGDLAGDVIKHDDYISSNLSKFFKGKKVDPVITDDSYGWLLTVYHPVNDAAGKNLCYVCADMSMDKLRSEEVHSWQSSSLYSSDF